MELASVSSAPAGFVSDVIAAVQYLETQINDPVAVNISVGYGEVAGQSLSVNDLGESDSFLQSVNYMDALFFTPNNNVNSRDILKHWVKEPSKLMKTPNQVYKTKSLRKSYQILVIFACHLYGQDSTETFSQSWVVMLDQLANEGRPFK